MNDDKLKNCYNFTVILKIHFISYNVLRPLEMVSKSFYQKGEKKDSIPLTRVEIHLSGYAKTELIIPQSSNEKKNQFLCS